MDVSNLSSSYRFKPKAPERWLVKKYKRSDRSVNTIDLKPWQTEAHLELRDSTRGFIQAFCGSGKTIAARSIAAYKIHKTNKMQVFCVPKNDIGNDGFSSFFDINIPFKDKLKKLSCHSPINFCDFKVVQKTDELISILVKASEIEKPEDTFQIRSTSQIVCTHQCLMAAFKKIKKKAKKDPDILKKFIANKTFWIDEGHHIKTAKKDEKDICMNFLGKFVKYVLDNPDTGSEIFVMTATPFRADHGSLIPGDKTEDFCIYSLDFVEHFKTLGIETVDVNFEIYKNSQDLFKLVAKNIADELDRKHFVFVPRTGSKWRRKKEDVYKLMDEIYKAIMLKKKCTLEFAKSMVLDLVTENTQDFNDRLLKQEPKNGQPHNSRYAVVVACMKCREGSDWCPADRIHNTAVEDSPPLNFQTNGRLFREFPGKNNVKIRYYIKRFITTGKTKREFIVDRVNYMLHYMLIDDLFNPIMVETPMFKYKKDKTHEKSYKRSKTTLGDIFSFNYYVAKKTLLQSFEKHNLNEENSNRLIQKIIDKFLPNKETYEKNQITEIKLAWKAFLLRTASKDMRNKGIDISYIRKNGFDIVAEKAGVSGNMFTSTLTIGEMERFRDVARLARWDDDTNRKRAEYLYKYAQTKLGRRIVKNRIAKNSSNPDLEAISIIKSEDGNWIKFNNRLNKLTEKQKVSFSVEDVAISLNLSKEELSKKLKDWRSFLPSNAFDDLCHPSWF